MMKGRARARRGPPGSRAPRGRAGRGGGHGLHPGRGGGVVVPVRQPGDERRRLADQQVPAAGDPAADDRVPLLLRDAAVAWL